MNTEDMVVKSLHSNKSFLTSPTRAAGYTTINMSIRVLKSPNTDKKCSTFPTRASEYSTMNVYHVVMKSLNRNKSFIISPTMAAKYMTMNTVDMIVKSPNSGENFLTSSASTNKTDYAIIEQIRANNKVHTHQVKTNNREIKTANNIKIVKLRPSQTRI